MTQLITRLCPHGYLLIENSCLTGGLSFLQKLQYQLCCFINTEEKNMEVPIAYHIFLCLSLPDKMWNLLTENGTCPSNWCYFYYYPLHGLTFVSPSQSRIYNHVSDRNSRSDLCLSLSTSNIGQQIFVPKTCESHQYK